MLIVLTTMPTQDGAENLATQIVTAKLATCVQILPKMTSFYFWEGEIRKEEERLLLIKTLPEKYPEIEAFITENHSYDVPEIVALASLKVAAKYREWIESYLE